MYTPDENDIDRVSRDAAEHYNAPGSPDWNTLRQTLDKELPQEKEKKRRGFLFFILLAGLFLAGSTIWYAGTSSKTIAKASSASTKNQNNTTGKISTKSITPENTKPVTTDLKSPEKESDSKNALKTTSPNASIPDSKVTTSAGSTIKTVDSTKITQGTTTSAPKTNKPISNTQQIQKNNSYTKISPLTPAGKQFRTGHPINTGAAIQTDDIAKSNKRGYKKSPGIVSTNMQNDLQSDLPEGKNFTDAAASFKTHKQIANHPIVNGKHPENSTAESNKDIVAKNEDVGVNDKNEVAITTTKENESLVKPVAIDTTNHTTTTKKDITAVKTAAAPEKTDSVKTAPTKIKSKSKNNKAILLGLTAGLDQSTIKFTYGSGVGYNIGFMGGYQFNNHWSVYTGAVYTKKNYKLNGADYHPPKHYWTTYVNLQTVEGYCKMWEFPLEARYTFNPGARHPFFINTGLSSYIMTKQAYDYDYKTMTGTSASGYWNTDSTFNHPFSILDLSFGFQKRVGKNLNLQIEPYGKIPLGGVGFGNIRLSSFGVNLTVQYKKALKR